MESKKITSGQWWKANRRWLALFAGALALFLIGTLIVLPHVNPKPTAGTRNERTITPTNPAPLDEAPSIGPKTAPVTIIEYADFGCPSCWYWHKSGILDQLRIKYGDKIRFIWRDYAVITLRSSDAAEAGQCANEQGKFWMFHDAVYDHEGNISASDLEAYAAEIGLDMSQFKTCVNSHRYLGRVNAEMAEAFNYGYNGAPFFLINNRPLIGAQPLQIFESMIDPLLAQK
jgi:protein-disulfide isomerase